MGATDFNNYSSKTITEEQIQTSLRLILSSRTFTGAERLKAFLSYVVEEELAGRGQQIRAKRIAADVYNRSVLSSSEQNTHVRVDAGRLRQRLKLFYADEGIDEQLRISIKTGGYVPIFDKSQNGNGSKTWRTNISFLTSVLVTFSIVLVAIIAVVAVSLQPGDDFGKEKPRLAVIPANSSNEAERLVLFEQSPAALQSKSLVDEARELTFPPLNSTRLKAAISLCALAIELAPKYYAGYSCSARAIGFLAFASDAGSVRRELVAKASTMADRAVEIDPTRANAQSARAWVMFVGGDFDAAVKAGKRAIELNPENRSAWNYSAMMAIFNGEGSSVISIIDTHSFTSNLDQLYHPFILAAAKFQGGSYADAIHYIERGAAKTGHISALMTSILAASYFAVGDMRKAQNVVKKMQQLWPESSFEQKILRLYRHAENANQIITRVYQIDPNLVQAAH